MRGINDVLDKLLEGLWNQVKGQVGNLTLQEYYVSIENSD